MEVYSVLTLDGKMLGIRFKKLSKFFDVEVSALWGMKKENIKDIKEEALIRQDYILVTEDELKYGFVVEDKSTDRYFCMYALAVLRNEEYAESVVMFNSATEFAEVLTFAYDLDSKDIKGVLEEYNKRKELAMELLYELLGSVVNLTSLFSSISISNHPLELDKSFNDFLESFTDIPNPSQITETD